VSFSASNSFLEKLGFQRSKSHFSFSLFVSAFQLDETNMATHLGLLFRFLVCREAIYKLQKSTSKFHQPVFQLATSQLFQKLKSSAQTSRPLVHYV
jgi:hypothetical protein